MKGFPSLSYKEATQDPLQFVSKLRNALLTVGFFNLVVRTLPYISVSAMVDLSDSQDIDKVIPDWNARWNETFASSEEFFELPLDTKNEISMINSRHFRGYAANKEEVTAGLPDWREQTDFG